MSTIEKQRLNLYQAMGILTLVISSLDSVSGDEDGADLAELTYVQSSAIEGARAIVLAVTGQLEVLEKEVQP